MRNQSTIYNKSNHLHEFYATSTWVRDKLYEMIPDWVHTILDPCAGEGGLEKFGDNKYQYTLIDIENRGEHINEVCDFLKRQRKDGEFYDAVVLNPPFGETNEFVKQCFKYTNDIFLIAPLKTAFKDFDYCIVNYYGNWRIPFDCFGVLTSIGLFHLHIDDTFNISNSKKEYRPKKLDKSKTLAAAGFVYINEHIQHRPFLVHKITKGRILRNEEIINVTDIGDPDDNSVFIATATSANKKTIKGDKIYRYIKYFDTKEEAMTFRSKYNDNDEYIRDYCYSWGSNLLGLHEIPLL